MALMIGCLMWLAKTFSVVKFVVWIGKLGKRIWGRFETEPVVITRRQRTCPNLR
jgi:hypothetical protein